jgi:hypothetical protein
MNFEHLKERVQAHAAVAVDAARSFRNFDQMAANDDYIHHSDLRTPEARTSERINTGISSRAISGNSSSESARRASRHEELLKQMTQFSMELEDNDHNVDEESKDMSMLIKLQKKEEEEVEKRSKNPKRFLEDLDHRLSLPDIPVDEPGEVFSPIVEESTTQPHWARWMTKNAPAMVNIFVKSAPKEQELRPMLGPLSRRQSEFDGQDDEDPMHHVAVASSSILGADDQAAFERLKHSSDPISFISNSITQNPHFCFILFTLVFGSLVYFYTRHREELDDVS